MGLRWGGREREDEQTEQGGKEGWSKHMAFGTALEQPVPKKIKEEEEELLILILILMVGMEGLASASAPERM